MRSLDRLNELARKWWPLTASLMAGVVIGTVIYIFWTVVDERSYFEAEQARDRRQDAQVAELLEQTGELVEHQRRSEASREERFAEAFAALDRVLTDQFAAHDRNVAEKLNELLTRIAALLDRPAGVPLDPVAAREVDETPAPRSPREPQEPRRPPAEPAPTSTTTTTSPGQSGLCDRIPTAFPCRSSR